MRKRKRNYETVSTATIPRVRPKRPLDPALVESFVIPSVWGLALSAATSVLAMVVTVCVQLSGLVAWPWWTSGLVGVGVFASVLAWRLWVGESDRRFLLLGEDSASQETVETHDRFSEPHKLIYVNQRQAAKRDSRDFRFFLETCYKGQTGRRFWLRKVLPSGQRMDRATFDDWTLRLIKAGLASRNAENGKLILTSDYRDALLALRELL